MNPLIPALKKNEALIAEMDAFLDEKKVFDYGGWDRAVICFNGRVSAS